MLSPFEDQLEGRGEAIHPEHTTARINVKGPNWTETARFHLYFEGGERDH